MWFKSISKRPPLLSHWFDSDQKSIFDDIRDILPQGWSENLILQVPVYFDIMHFWALLVLQKRRDVKVRKVQNSDDICPLLQYSGRFALSTIVKAKFNHHQPARACAVPTPTRVYKPKHAKKLNQKQRKNQNHEEDQHQAPSEAVTQRSKKRQKYQKWNGFSFQELNQLASHKVTTWRTPLFARQWHLLIISLLLSIQQALLQKPYLPCSSEPPE